MDKIDLWNDPNRIDPIPEADIEDELIAQRQDICDACTHLKAYICSRCLCFMPLKIRIKTTKCPLGKW